MNDKVDYSIGALLKKGGKVTGCMGFSCDPKNVYKMHVNFCANFLEIMQMAVKDA